MRIKVLLENTASLPDFRTEHGLSLLIETGNQRILFDMGQSDSFAENAEVLGADLSSVDAAVLSHGHYYGLAQAGRFDWRLPFYEA